MRPWGWLVIAALGCRLRFEPLDDGDGSLRDDGGLRDDAGTSAQPCNQITRVADNFDDNVQDPELWGGSYSNVGTSIAEVGGEAVVTPAASAADRYAAYQTWRFYDLTAQRVSVEVSQVAGVGATTSVQIVRDIDWSAAIHQKGGLLWASTRVAGVYMTRMMIPYVAGAHRFWAFQEVAGKLQFQWSTDGQTFTTFVQIDAPFPLNSLRLSLQAGTDTAITSPGEAHYGTVNNGVAVPGIACRVSTFVDRFDDGLTGFEWENSFVNPCCARTEAGGVATISTDGTIGHSALRTSAGYDLSDGEVVVSVVTPPTPASTFYALLRARPDSGRAVEIRLRSTTVQAIVDIGGSLNTMMSATSPGEIHLRMREATGTLSFEISADKVSWRLLRSEPTPFSLADVAISVQAGLDSAPSNAATISFDDFGVP